jgi:sugar lactone lactonase YvrE
MKNTLMRLELSRWLAKFGPALIAAAALTACGGDGDGAPVLTAVAPPPLLVGNTRGANVVVVDRQTGAYVKDFIAAGSGGLVDPDDLTFGPDGNLYVSSGTNTGGQILRYNGSTGAFIGVFAQGNGLMRPYGNAFGPDGNLYVASFRSDKIMKFNGTTGAFMSVFAQGNGTAAGLLNGPNDLLFGADGKLYVTTQGSVADMLGGISYKFDSQVLRYDVATGAGEVFAPAPKPSAGGGGYVSMLGLVFGPDGLLYTSDYAGGIRSYDTSTKALKQTIDTGKVFGGTIATNVGALTFGVDGSLFAPVFNANSTGVVANGVVKCSVASSSCALLSTSTTNLVRPIGIVSALP